jgi:predicted ribosome quality control (RQC) complex YloA/Tae2 family protein
MSAPTKVTSISGLEMKVLARELSALKGWYISNIHSLGDNQVFRMKSSDGEADLVISPVFGAWVTTRPAHGITREFTTSLRGALLRLKLEDVSQLGLDRVLFLNFAGGETIVRLILELMPPGNIILTDPTGRITLTLREFKGQHRTVGKGRMYIPPPQNRASPEEVDEKSLGEALAREKTVGRALGRGLSLPRRYVDEILAKVSMTQDQPTPVTQEKVVEIVEAIRETLAALEHPSPSLVEVAGGLEVMAVKPTRGVVIESAGTVSELMDKAFSSSLVESETEATPQKEDQHAKEIEVTINRLQEQSDGLRDRAVKMRGLAGEIRGTGSLEGAQMMLGGASLDAALMSRVGSQSSVAAMSSTLFDEAKSAEAEVKRIQEVSVGLASRLKRAKKAIPKPTVQIVMREKKEWYQKFRWFFTSEGKLAIGGRDAQSNTILVKKHMTESDVAYHADLFGSPFFILKEGKDQTPAEVRQMGQATASFSSAWKTGLSAADAYWVLPDQVSGSAPSGEYLARGSFVIRGKKNFVTKNPVELAIGIDAGGRMVSGPEEAMMKQSDAYVVIIPNREKSSDTAKKVLFELKKMYGEGFGAVDLDDVMRALPSGGGKIVRKRDTRTASNVAAQAERPIATSQDGGDEPQQA